MDASPAGPEAFAVPPSGHRHVQMFLQLAGKQAELTAQGREHGVPDPRLIQRGKELSSALAQGPFPLHLLLLRAEGFFSSPKEPSQK